MNLQNLNPSNWVAPAYRWIGAVLIGTPASLKQEADFFGPVGDRWIPNTLADARDQQLMRGQLFGEFFRRQLYTKVALLGGIACLALCAACLLFRGGIAQTESAWAKWHTPSTPSPQTTPTPPAPNSGDTP